MKKKIKLSDLKVQSFITSLSEEQKLTAQGGILGVPEATVHCSDLTICVACASKDGVLVCVTFEPQTQLKSCYRNRC
ncbi:MAG: pinensin family lanthipeptide [Bacteroidota bacterium]